MQPVPDKFWTDGVGRILLSGALYGADSERDPESLPHVSGMSGVPAAALRVSLNLTSPCLDFDPETVHCVWAMRAPCGIAHTVLSTDCP